jgi:hypothetical protein
VRLRSPTSYLGFISTRKGKQGIISPRGKGMDAAYRWETLTGRMPARRRSEEVAAGPGGRLGVGSGRWRRGDVGGRSGGGEAIQPQKCSGKELWFAGWRGGARLGSGPGRRRRRWNPNRLSYPDLSLPLEERRELATGLRKNPFFLGHVHRCGPSKAAIKPPRQILYIAYSGISCPRRTRFSHTDLSGPAQYHPRRLFFFHFFFFSSDFKICSDFEICSDF